MKEHKNDYNNLFKAKDIADGLGRSSRGISGTMRKLVNDGFCESMSKDPVIYMLTEKGKNYKIEEIVND